MALPSSLSEDGWNRELLYLDPGVQSSHVDAPGPQDIIRPFLTFLQRRLRLDPNDIVVSSPDHSPQRDAMSCGVFICYYAYMLTQRRPLNFTMPVARLRQLLFYSIVGDCSVGVSVQVKETICRLCLRRVGADEALLHCEICGQVCHGSCMPDTSTTRFVCPPKEEDHS